MNKCYIESRRKGISYQIYHRNCLLKDTIEGKIEGTLEATGRRERRRKQLLDGLKERKEYWKKVEEALDRTPWRTCLGRGCGSVSRQAAE
jgi:hypothetical protein